MAGGSTKDPVNGFTSATFADVPLSARHRTLARRETDVDSDITLEEIHPRKSSGSESQSDSQQQFVPHGLEDPTSLQDRHQKKKKRVGLIGSALAIASSSCMYNHLWFYNKGLTHIPGLNVLLIFVPFSWIAHFASHSHDGWSQKLTFTCMCPSRRLGLMPIWLMAFLESVSLVSFHLPDF
jgi:hypothetical protein